VRSRDLAARWSARRRNATPPPPSGAPGFKASLERRSGCVRVVLEGELDMACTDEFASALAEAEADRPENLEIDLRGLAFLDSTGLSQLFAANRRAREHGRRVVLIQGPGGIEEVLELARVEDVFDVIHEPPAP
jgi:anti-sigma B factor antagonist